MHMKICCITVVILCKYSVLRGAQTFITALFQVSHKLSCNLSKRAEYYDVNIVSLYGLNNLRKLQYHIQGGKLFQLHQQLQTISSSLISEVNFIYYPNDDRDDNHEYWGDIDNLMIKKFPALRIVTMELDLDVHWRLPWARYNSKCIDALPKLHQKGILRAALPRQVC